MRTSMPARFGDQILSVLTWAVRQRTIVVKTCGSSQRDRFIPWIDMSLDKVPTRRTRSTASMISLESSTHILSPSQSTHPTASSGMQVKAMAWNLGDDCTASTTPRRRRPWRTFSKFKTLRVLSELRIWDLHWRTGS